jgi:hypothetical protein
MGLLSVLGAFLLSCAKDPLRVDRNRPPETFLVAAPVDTTVDVLNYSYRIHLYWRGEDPDGYVVGFLWAWDDSSFGAFRFTSKTDSVFELTVNDSSQLSGGIGANPGNAKPHTFYIRAVDNLGKQDPSLTIFNRRTINAGTEAPAVTYSPPLVPRTDGKIDTICDHTPFVVRWSGRDPDGVVTRYRFNVGTFQSNLSPDSLAYFNDPSQPTSTTLVQALYTMTVTAVDNAISIGRNQYQFVVNADPNMVPAQRQHVGHTSSPTIMGSLSHRRAFAPGIRCPGRRSGGSGTARTTTADASRIQRAARMDAYPAGPSCCARGRGTTTSLTTLGSWIRSRPRRPSFGSTTTIPTFSVPRDSSP